MKTIEFDGGIPEEDFNQLMDSIIEKSSIVVDPGLVQDFSEEQKTIFHFVRKSVNRITYKNR